MSDEVYAYFYLQGEKELTDQLTDRLYESGFDDSLVSFRDGLVFVSFSTNIPAPLVAPDPMENWYKYQKKCTNFRDDCFKRLMEAGFTPVYSDNPEREPDNVDYNKGVTFRRGENTTLERLTVRGSIKGFHLLERVIDDVDRTYQQKDETGIETLLTIGLADGTQLYIVDGCDSFEIYDNEAETRYNYPWLFPTP
jgi:hypothetical protein